MNGNDFYATLCFKFAFAFNYILATSNGNWFRRVKIPWLCRCRLYYMMLHHELWVFCIDLSLETFDQVVWNAKLNETIIITLIFRAQYNYRFIQLGGEFLLIVKRVAYSKESNKYSKNITISATFSHLLSTTMTKMNKAMWIIFSYIEKPVHEQMK